jgi:mannose-6-phosphate isomerase-like protein (cupin superfamily)
MKSTNRRTLLSGIAALTASTLVSRDAFAEEPKEAAAGPFLVRDDGSRGDGPWVIQHTDAITAKISSADTEGRYSVLELNTPPGRGPALHIHPSQNEWFFLLRGSIGLQCGKERVVLNAGDSYLAPMGVPHAYVTLGTDTARILNLFDPAGQMEGFFKEYARLLSMPGPPDMQKLNELSEQHGMKVVGAPLHATDFASVSA